MATPFRTPIAALMLSILTPPVFSDAASASSENRDALPSRATLTLRVTPATAGTPLTTPGGTVRLLLSVTPDSESEISPTTAHGRNAVKDATLLAGPDGPALIWTTHATNPTGFTASALITDSQSVRSFNDRAARAVHWPIKGWPEGVASTLQPDAHADELNAEARRLVEGWLGAQTRAVTPAVLAKYLAARTLNHARPGLESLSVPAGQGDGISGLRSTGVANFARTGAGSELDMLRAYNAALRIAGIPSRLIVGVRAGRDAQPTIHAWVEFYLYDERARRGEWVAVDLIAQRWLDPEPPALADAWKRFGENDARLIPMLIGLPSASAGDATLLTPWRIECDPPCAPLRVSVSVSEGDRSVVRR